MMEKKILTKHPKMSVYMIGSIVVLLSVFGVVIAILGYITFSSALESEYTTSTYHMADTATTLVQGDKLDDYLAGKDEEEYRQTWDKLDEYCHKMSVSLIYIIVVDRSDYGRFVSVFNVVDNTVDNSEYSVWEKGYKRDTTNDEYREKYEKLYQGRSAYETLFRSHPVDGQHPHITTMVPVKNSQGGVEAILCMQRPIRELDDARELYLLNVGGATLAVILFFILCAARFVRRQFVRPIQNVAEEAARFAKENTKGEDLSGISSYLEIYELAHSLDTMETDMLSYMENLKNVTAEKERIGVELDFAAKIQLNSIPNEFPAFPERKDFDVFASMTPAKGIGGDFYNFFLLDEDHLVLIMGDVSGKGVPAALFMMVSNIVISNRVKMGGDPSEIIKFVNEEICKHNKANMFCTLWLGILELSSGKMKALNAGHEDLILCRKGGSFEVVKTRHDIVVGVMEGYEFHDLEFEMQEGDKLFLYTDGVPEASDAGNAMFGMDRLVEVLNEYKDGTAEEILEGVRAGVNRFVGDAPQFDDLTMLCFEKK